MTRRGRMLLIGVAAAVGAMCLGCGITLAASGADKHTKEISRADLGDAWPLIVSSGTIECRNGSEVVFTAGGKTYAVNGTAMGAKKYGDVRDIWADDPNVDGLKVNIAGLLNAGQALCGTQ